MVAVLVKLKLTLLKRSFSGSAGRTVGIILAALWVGFMTLMAVIGLIAARFGDVNDVSTWVVPGFALVTVMWMLAPLLVFGVDNTVDPSRFALLPQSARQLQPGLLIAGLLGLPGLALILLAAGQVVTWARSPLALVVALISALAGVVTAFLLSRVVTAGFAKALASRRMRDLAGLLLGALLMLFIVGDQFLGRAAGKDPAALRTAAEHTRDILGWTPFGWAWAAPAEVAAGHTLSGMARLALAVLLTGALWWLWGTLLDRALVSIGEGETHNEVQASGLVDRLCPPTPTGAVAARCLRYWRRDPRYLTSLVSVVIVPVVFTFSLKDSAFGPMAAPVMLAAMIGPTLMTDLAYDNSAFWVHVSSGIPMRADRWGRVFAFGVLIVPLLVLLLLGSAIVSGHWDALAWGTALSVAVLGVSCGLACAAGAYYPGTAPPPGANPFAVKSGGGIAVVAVMLGCWLTTALLCLPVIVLILFGLSAIALPVGFLVAAVVLVAGVRMGAARMERTAPEILTRVAT